MADSDTLQSEISTATETVFHGPDLMSVLTGAAGSVLKIIRSRNWSINRRVIGASPGS